MKHMLPTTGVAVAMGGSKPRHRDWVPSPLHPITLSEIRASTGAIFERMALDLKAGDARWAELVSSLRDLPPEMQGTALGQLESIDPSTLDCAASHAIWTALRQVLAQNRSYPTATWALPSEQIERLAQLYDKWTPADLLGRVAYLFEYRPTLPEGKEADWRAHEAAITDRQGEAVREVKQAIGLGGLIDLAGRVKEAAVLGRAIGVSQLLSPDEEDALLRDTLANASAPLRICGQGFVMGRHACAGQVWGEHALERNMQSWSPEQAADFLIGLPINGCTWDLVDRLGEPVKGMYWKRLRPIGIATPADSSRAARTLLEHRRPYTAMDVTWLMNVQPDGVVADDLLFDVLEGIASVPPEEDPSMLPMGDKISDLLSRLENSSATGSDRLARLQWLFLPVLDSSGIPRTLARALQNGPSLFVEMVNLAYRAKGEEPRELTAEDKGRAERSHQLLRASWGVPGASDDGSIDPAVLEKWVDSAREGLAATNHLDAGDMCVGQMLSGAPPDRNGLWPPPAVSALIERISSTELDRAFIIGTLNSRSAVTKPVGEGGRLERGLAETYERYAALLVDRWPRTASLVRRIAASYRDYARHEDRDVELNDALW